MNGPGSQWRQFHPTGAQQWYRSGGTQGYLAGAGWAGPPDKGGTARIPHLFGNPHIADRTSFQRGDPNGPAYKIFRPLGKFLSKQGRLSGLLPPPLESGSEPASSADIMQVHQDLLKETQMHMEELRQHIASLPTQVGSTVVGSIRPPAAPVVTPPAAPKSRSKYFSGTDQGSLF